ncbi:nuclear transport factor 2 family protein [Occultella gossypii]|uniref:Nuclear transport factor 2 family protein n=1 Tax=Occultella gossypii TaxID=2800820 RepID=A0ABS7S6T4_9MICO|nr:nuclear transport factor 2 family protein [Occultella gossypii]MBZ2195445.1 nuclear transport factor 2 family protein [Occultella gossypii]
MPDILPAADAHEISTLKARYFYYLDTKQWARLVELFASDASFEGFAFGADGPADFVATVSAFLADVQSTHQGFMPRLGATGPDTARGVWSMHDYLTWDTGSRIYKDVDVPAMYGIRGYGYYEEEYRRVDGRWLISFSRLVRTRIDPLVNRGPAPEYDVLGPDVSWVG